jgi:hypothetical protein
MSPFSRALFGRENLTLWFPMKSPKAETVLRLLACSWSSSQGTASNRFCRKKSATLKRCATTLRASLGGAR